MNAGPVLSVEIPEFRVVGSRHTGRTSPFPLSLSTLPYSSVSSSSLPPSSPPSFSATHSRKRSLARTVYLAGTTPGRREQPARDSQPNFEMSGSPCPHHRYHRTPCPLQESTTTKAHSVVKDERESCRTLRSPSFSLSLSPSLYNSVVNFSSRFFFTYCFAFCPSLSLGLFALAQFCLCLAPLNVEYSPLHPFDGVDRTCGLDKVRKRESEKDEDSLRAGGRRRRAGSRIKQVPLLPAFAIRRRAHVTRILAAFVV